MYQVYVGINAKVVSVKSFCPLVPISSLLSETAYHTGTQSLLFFSNENRYRDQEMMP